MTISATTPEVSYAGDNTTVAFPIPFVFDTAADLKVLSTDADGNVAVITTGFTVSGGNRSTGTLTFGAAPAAGITITILDDPEREQATDYVSNDPFPAESHEHALDRGVRISKRLYQMILRCLRTQDGDPASGAAMVFPTVAARRGKFAMWSDDPIGKLEPAVGLPVGEPLSQSIIGGLLYPQTSAEINAGVTPNNPIYPQLHVSRYGGSIQAAVNVAKALGGGLILMEEGGAYTVSQNVTLNGVRNLTIDGQGATVTSDTRITQLFNISGDSDHIVIKNLNWSPPPYAGIGSQQARMVAVTASVDCLEIEHCDVRYGALVTCESGDDQIRCRLLKISQCRADGGGGAHPVVPEINGTMIGGVRQVLIDQCEFFGYFKDQIKLTIAMRRDTGQLSGPFSTVNASQRVQVAWADHPFLDGDRVVFSGASAVGGVTIDGEYRVNRVIDAGTFEILHTSAASSTATGGGTVDYEMKLPLTEMVSIKRNIFRDPATGTPDSGIDIYGTGRHTIVEENLFIRMNTGVMFKTEVDGGGIQTGDVYRSIIAKNRFVDCRNALYLAVADQCTVRDNEFLDNGLNEAGAAGSRDIFVIGPIRGLTIEANSFTRSREQAIRLTLRAFTGSSDVVEAAIVRNRFEAQADNVIHLASDNNPRFFLTIKDNTFIGWPSNRDAMELRGVGGSIFDIDGNFFMDSAGIAISVAGATAADIVKLGEQHYVNHTGQQVGTVSTVTIARSAASSGIGYDGAARYAAAIASTDCELAGVNQVTLASRRVKNGGTRVIVAGDSASGDPLTANRKWQVVATTGEVSATGSFTGSATFTDYAEYFENLTTGAIPLGTIVTLDGERVRPAGPGDEILGVVSGTAIIRAGDSPFTWSGRFLTGEFGEPLYEEVTDEDTNENYITYKQNPEWDPSQPQVARSERPAEWTCVGLLGQLRVRIAADVGPGDYINAVGGKADGTTRLRCMVITQAFDAEKGYAIAKCLLR